MPLDLVWDQRAAVYLVHSHLLGTKEAQEENKSKEEEVECEEDLLKLKDAK